MLHNTEQKQPLGTRSYYTAESDAHKVPTDEWPLNPVPEPGLYLAWKKGDVTDT